MDVSTPGIWPSQGLYTVHICGVFRLRRSLITSLSSVGLQTFAAL